MPTPSQSIDELKRQLAQLDALIAEGVLTGNAGRAKRDALERALVAAVTAPAAPRLPRRLVGGVLVFVLAFGLLGYGWRGNAGGWSVGPGEAVQTAANAPEDPKNLAAADAQIEAMVAKLADRLKDKPDDVDGLTMLARSYTALRRFSDALPLYKRLVALRPRDAQALVDYADALAVVNNRSLDGEPEKLVMQAVQLDPGNLKALSLAGTVAFNRADYVNAVAYWQKAVDISEPGGELARQLQGAMDEARQRGGMPAVAQAAPPNSGKAAVAPAPAPPTSASASASASASTSTASVTGRVSLSAALMSRAAPGDTVFIFARAVSGPKMPLAILRKQVRDLPLDFTLDDSLAMSPAARLSSSPQVVVGARISKSGNAMPQPGDLQVLSAPVALGTRALQLEISETVQ